jgi:adenylate kinase
LLLDGHCVLRTEVNKHERISPTVFKSLMCTSMILLRSAPKTILGRLAGRGDSSWAEEEIVSFDAAELEHANFVAGDLKIALHVMSDPTMDEFMTVVRRLMVRNPP